MTQSENNGRKIPSSWIWTNLSEICKKIQDGTHFSPKNQYQESGKERYLYITSKNIRDHGMDLSDVTYVDQATHQSIYKRCNPEYGDVLLVKDGVKTGTVAVNKLREEFSLLSSVALLKVNQAILSPYYLRYFLSSPTGFKTITNSMSGTAIKRIILDKVRHAKVVVPPLAEQQRIVDKIEELFSDLDSGIDSLKKAKQQLKVYRQAVLKWAFEGKLTAQWREEQERQGKLESADTLLVQIKAEREQRYQKELEVWQAEVEAWDAIGKERNKPRKPKKLKDLDPINSQDLAELVSLPHGWQWERLGNLADIIGGVTKGRNLDGRSTISLPYLRVANVQDGYLDLEQIKYIDVLREDLEKYHLGYGDILYTEGGDRDKLGRGTIWKGEIENCIHQNHVFRARLFSDSINNSFIAYFSRTTLAKDYFFKRAKQTVNLASINMTILSNFPVPIPSPGEQGQILEEIESRLSICDQLEADIETNLKKAEALRQSILKQAFEGKLVPQDPNDEPASVLLERIKKQRQENEATKKTKKEGVRP